MIEGPYVKDIYEKVCDKRDHTLKIYRRDCVIRGTIH